MKKVITILSNDRVDRHGEQMSISDLKNLRNQTNARIMSSYSEHDYRNPPIARVAKAFILNENGANNLYGEVEFFEISDIGNESTIKNKELTIRKKHELSIGYDRSYKINGLKDDVDELQSLISTEPAQFEVKKNVEPISTLTIFLGILTFAGSTFIGGFLKEAGSDFWIKLKEIIRKNSEINDDEKLYQFVATIEKEYYKVEVIINFTDPLNIDCRDILTMNSELIDSKINEYYTKSIRARRIVFNVTGGVVMHEYSVYRSGLPFDIRDINSYEALINANSNKY